MLLFLLSSSEKKVTKDVYIIHRGTVSDKLQDFGNRFVSVLPSFRDVIYIIALYLFRDSDLRSDLRSL